MAGREGRERVEKVECVQTRWQRQDGDWVCERDREGRQREGRQREGWQRDKIEEIVRDR